MNYGFVINNKTCIGCHACSVACKEEHQVPLGVYRTWVKYVEKGAFPNTQRNFTVLPQYVLTSSRKYEKVGKFRLQYHFGVIHLKNYFGATPKALYDYYKRHIAGY